MDTFTIFLMILIVLLSSTASGLMFWMALKNFESFNHNLTYVIILSMLFTPAGAWFLSLFYKMRENISALRNEKYKVRIIS